LTGSLPFSWPLWFKTGIGSWIWRKKSNQFNFSNHWMNYL
jgi:hypothetical protein